MADDHSQADVFEWVRSGAIVKLVDEETGRAMLGNYIRKMKRTSEGS